MARLALAGLVVWCGSLGSMTAASSGTSGAAGAADSPRPAGLPKVAAASAATPSASSAGATPSGRGAPVASSTNPLPSASSVASTAEPGGDEATGRQPSTPRTFVALGDSLTAWAFAPGSTSPGAAGVWPSVLAHQDSSLVLVNNAGIPGNTTSQMLSRLGRDVLAYKPDVLFLMGGTNDIGLDMSIANAVANIRRIVETARANGITVILMTIPPVNGDYNYRTANRAEYNADLADLASQEGIMLVDVFSALATANGYLAPEYSAFDGLHLSQQGEQAVAETVYLALHPTVPPEEE